MNLRGADNLSIHYNGRIVQTRLNLSVEFLLLIADGQEATPLFAASDIIAGAMIQDRPFLWPFVGGALSWRWGLGRD